MVGYVGSPIKPPRAITPESGRVRIETEEAADEAEGGDPEVDLDAVWDPGRVARMMKAWESATTEVEGWGSDRFVLHLRADGQGPDHEKNRTTLLELRARAKQRLITLGKDDPLVGPEGYGIPGSAKFRQWNWEVASDHPQNQCRPTAAEHLEPGKQGEGEWTLHFAGAQWDRAATGHPRPLEVALLLDSLIHGFPSGLHSPERSNVDVGALRNISLDAERSPLRDDDRLTAAEVDRLTTKGHLVGPFDTCPLENAWVCTPFTLAKMKDGVPTGKWRVIVDPHDANLRTARRVCSCPRFNDVAKYIREIGPNGTVAKEDVVDAFRQLRYARNARHHGVVYVRGRGFYYPRSLCMGSRVSPPFFERVTRVLAWILREKLHLVRVLIYVDDIMVFFTEEEAQSAPAKMHAMRETCATLGVPLDGTKSYGPGPQPRLLGIDFNIPEETMALPEGKRQRIIQTCREWVENPDRRSTVTAAEEWVGVLQFGTTVFPSLRPLLGRAHRAIARALWKSSQQAHPTGRGRIPFPIDHRLQEDARCILAILDVAHPHTLVRPHTPPSLPYTYAGDCNGGSDACFEGWGAVGGDEWAAGAFDHATMSRARPPGKKTYNINLLELRAVFLLLLMKADEWQGKAIRIACDNEAAVNSLNRGLTSSRTAGETLRAIIILAAHHCITPTYVWINTHTNIVSDILSRHRKENVPAEAAAEQAGLDPKRRRRPESSRTYRNLADTDSNPTW